jgi:UDP-glucose 4-epimerase
MRNNTVVARNLIEAAVKGSVRNFIFSSTATVYTGESPDPLSETLPTGLISPYGRVKLMTEWMLEDPPRLTISTTSCCVTSTWPARIQKAVPGNPVPARRT